MLMFEELGKFLIIIGIVIALVGLALIIAPNVPFIGKLPGDIVIRKKNFTFYFPLATSILLSIFLSLIFWIINKR
jgi:hypothetical protein